MDPQREPGRQADEPSRNEDPWWLQPGTETCEVCLEAVHYEALYHCRECDQPLCMSCGVTVVERRIVLCASCSDEGDG